MTRRVVTASPDDTLATVRKMFRELEFHHLVVVERRRVIGLMSDRDLLRNLSPFIGRRTEREQDINCLNRKVHQVMTRHVVSCAEETSIADAGMLILERDLSCLPVLDSEGRCVGIVAAHDILGWCMVRCAGAPDSCAVPWAA